MAIFAVVLRRPNTEVPQRISDAFPDHFQLSETFWVVASTAMSEQVAVKAGIKGKGRAHDVSGVVFRLQVGYSGYTAPGLWEWLADHVEDF